MMAKRKRLYYDSYQSVKARQHKVNKKARLVRDVEIDDLMLNARSGKVNRKRRSRVGHVEKKYEA